MSDTTYPVRIEFPIAWGDMDALGHVNNVMYFRYFESVRMEYFRRVGMPLAEQGPILASTACDFVSPLAWPDTIRVETGISRFGKSSFTMAYRIFSVQQGMEVARGHGVCVYFDYTRKKSTPLPDALRQRMESLEVSIC